MVLAFVMVAESKVNTDVLLCDLPWPVYVVCITLVHFAVHQCKDVADTCNDVSVTDLCM